MPAFYAHDRFGRKVYSRLDGEIKQTIKKHSRQFAGTGSLFLLPALASK